jgi:adenylate cyclase class 2
MATELEVRFIDVNVTSLRQKIDTLGASLIFSTLFRITLFRGLSGEDREYIRVRDEGQKITLVHKRTYQGSMAAIEHEVGASSYEDAIALLDAIGLTRKRTEEKFRIHYELDGVSIDIDTWPGIPTYVEIEARSEQALNSTCEKLGFHFEQAFLGDAHDVFRHYGIEPTTVPNMVFSEEQKLLLIK